MNRTVAGWEPTKWWRVTRDKTLWCETSSEDEARDSMQPGDVLQQLWKIEEREWRVIEPHGCNFPKPTLGATFVCPECEVTHFTALRMGGRDWVWVSTKTGRART
jgi:hypothetical protein